MTQSQVQHNRPLNPQLLRWLHELRMADVADFG